MYSEEDGHVTVVGEEAVVESVDVGVSSDESLGGGSGASLLDLGDWAVVGSVDVDVLSEVSLSGVSDAGVLSLNNHAVVGSVDVGVLSEVGIVMGGGSANVGGFDELHL